MNASVSTASARDRLFRVLSPHNLRAFVVIVFCLVPVYYLWDRNQSFTLQAATQSITITTDAGLDNEWEIAGAILCRRIPAGEAVIATDASRCDADFYTQHEIAPTTGDDSGLVTLVWPADYQLTIQGAGTDELSVAITFPADAETLYFGDIAVPDQSLVIFPASELTRLGTLPLSGKVRIGQPPRAGASHILRAGTYEIRENLGLSGLSTVVAGGTLLLGDYAWPADRNGEPITASMFLADSADERAAFDIVLTTPQQPSAINIERVGGASAAFTTRWIDRVNTDALPIAITALLTLLATILNVLQGVERPREPKAPDGATPASAAANTSPATAPTQPTPADQLAQQSKPRAARTSGKATRPRPKPTPPAVPNS